MSKLGLLYLRPTRLDCQRVFTQLQKHIAQKQKIEAKQNDNLASRGLKRWQPEEGVQGVQKMGETL